MQAFVFEVANRPGELARVSDVAAQHAINIEAFCLGYGNRGITAFLTPDEKGLKSVLTSEGISYKEIPLLTIWLEDKPGTTHLVAKRLADAGVNIEFFAPVDFQTDRRATFAIGVDKIDAARTALSDQLVEWKVPEMAYASSRS